MLVLKEKLERECHGGLKYFFLFGNTKCFLLLMHVQSDNLIQNAQWFYNTALPGAKYLILYKNARVASCKIEQKESLLYSHMNKKRLCSWKRKVPLIV